MKTDIPEKLREIREESDVVKKFELARDLHTKYEKELRKNDLDIVKIKQAVKDGYIEFYTVGHSILCENYMGEIAKIGSVE